MAIAAAKDTIEIIPARQNQAGGVRILVEKFDSLLDPDQLALVDRTEGLR